MKSLKETLIERKEVLELDHKHHSSNKVNYVDAIIENLKCQEDLKKAIERYEILLNTLINIGNFKDYKGSKQDVVVDVINSLLRKHKQIFGNFEEVIKE